MYRNLITLCVCMCVISGLLGAWMGAKATLAAPITRAADDSPRTISSGTEDVRKFFQCMGYSNPFEVIASTSDQSLQRRYYHVRVAPDDVSELRQKLSIGWEMGHYNHAVYENGINARVKRSHNLPSWWNLNDPPAADHLMLDHGGQPKWYIVLAGGGDACLMWVEH